MPILSKEDERYGYEPGSFAFWRNLAVYFCVFSVLGHWMEIVYCSFMNVFGIVDADSLVWDDPMYPFLVYAMLYTWIVYPLCQKALGKLPLRAMNLLAAVVVIGFVVLCAVKFA